MDVGPFQAHELRVHYENNSPFAEVTALTREVEVSHWGNVYVEETYTLKHCGARLKVCDAHAGPPPSRACCARAAAVACTADQGWLRGCKGEWSRLEYMADPRQHGIASFRQLSAVLPRSAHSLYFRDEIGNVSSSHVRHLRDKLEVVLLPRFPLFGGWSVRPVPPRTHCRLLLALGPLQIFLSTLSSRSRRRRWTLCLGTACH